jgi:hypothetical protein
MPREGLEPTIPASERAKIVHATDRAATVIDEYLHILSYIRPSSPTFVLHALPISCSLTDHSNYVWLLSTSYESPHYALFSNLPSLYLSSVQIFS